MTPDPLTQMLTLVKARCTLAGGFRAHGEWSYRFQESTVVKLNAIVRGSCWLIADSASPVRLKAGDAVVLNRVRSVVLCTSPDLRPAEGADRPAQAVGDLASDGGPDEVALIGCHVELDAAADEVFTSALPAVTHVGPSSSEAAEMRRLIERIGQETAGMRPGAGFAADQHAQLLLLEVLRLCLDDENLTRRGWLRLFADQHLRPAVALMHQEPSRRWSLPELAAAAGMSRSHFAHRFREVAGEPPLTYLTHFRIHLAKQALRESDTTLAVLAARLGYASESSFSHAFARTTGFTPGGYRRATNPSRSRSGAGRPGEDPAVDRQGVVRLRE
ncbi:AraC family transcriptional regulator [Streptomyces minutiscleroticus]|uniref:Cupin n=1 Tax=Streptomyces minutiscleroticus TaxID=68238 RepID=A0A918NXY7_9ACTN|nr:AraC family transcriptional regulator [Streptomyces minutiscleroticus]GGY04551.1 cupin [Streptomyces minutiscleroticus]